MRAPNFCVECGEQLTRKGWRARLRGHFCVQCAQRLGTFASARPIITMVLVAVIGFAIGKCMRPSPPPLIIQRAANSPLSDTPVGARDNSRPAQPSGKSPAQPSGESPEPSGESKPNANLTAAADDAVYICGARTKKGTPCHRRVHVLGERCFQHKGMASLVPLSKLVIRP